MRRSGPGRYCSTRHRVPFDLTSEGSNQSDKISHIDMGDDLIDTVISHIISPYPISMSHIDLSYRYRIIFCHSGSNGCG